MGPVIGITAEIETGYLKLNRRYADAIEDAGACPVLLFPAKTIEPLALKIDGLLIPGGDDLHPSYYNEEAAYEMKIVDRDRSDFELALICEIIKLRKPVLGICYGMQFINVAFGGSLYQDIKAQLPMAIDHKKDYHIIKVRDNNYVPAGEFNVNSSHHQAVKVPGRGLKTIAVSDDNIIEAICMSDYPFLLGVQWHPERLKDDLSAGIFRSFVKAAIS
ncbi:MAG: gamma-glutamyl-gamma-aminobutyrate hydrolase family protein [Nitrospirae bacterium]|nr:gamma-glutamyl-gamma-aminobutyrate hydrolase family protein [Nitrospirota bacterium]